MKKNLLNFGNQVLSRGEMKNILGGADCCTGSSQASCNGVCGPNGGTCGWQAAMPKLGLGAGCVCNYAPSGGEK